MTCISFLTQMASCTHSLAPHSSHLIYHLDGSSLVHIELPCFAGCHFVHDAQIIHPVLTVFRKFPVFCGYKQSGGECTCSPAISQGSLLVGSWIQGFIPAVCSVESTWMGLLGVMKWGQGLLYVERSGTLTKEVIFGLKDQEGSCKTPRIGPQQNLLRWRKIEHLGFVRVRPRKSITGNKNPWKLPLFFFWLELYTLNPKGNQPWIFIGRTDVEAEAPVVWPPDMKSWLVGKDPDAGIDWIQKEKGTTDDEMFR